MMLGGAIAIGFAPIGLRLSEFGPQATAFWRFHVRAADDRLRVIYASGGKLGRPSAMALVAGVFFGLDVAFWHASLLMTSVANATFLVNLGNAAVGFVAWIVLARTADENLAGRHGRRAAGRFLPVARVQRPEIRELWLATCSRWSLP
jgi:drug/metabolite transporter (DMT)-like permease